jgi:cysteine-rich repeat protein
VAGVCGNGTRESGEECDDGNLLDGDDCSSDCTLNGLDAEALVEASCNFSARCEPARLAFAHESLEDCKARVAVTTLANFAIHRAAIAAGRSLFDQDAFDACLTALDTGDCDLIPSEDGCDFITGVGTAGAACSVSTACAPDLFCNVAVGGECGTCQARAAAGGDCSTSVCVEGTGCFEVGGGLRKCVHDDLDENAACGTVETGLCRGHLQCVGSTTRTCERPAAHGATCDVLEESGPDCDVFDNQRCVADKCVDLSFNPPGGSCAGANVCDVDGRCDVDDTCDALPTAGMPCVFGACAPDHFCDGATCAALRTEGGSCTTSGQCEDPLVCAGDPKTCRAFQFVDCP